MMRKYMAIILAFIFIISTFSVSSFANTEVLEEQLGEKVSDILISEIKERINQYATITPDQAKEMVREVCQQYGVELTEEQLVELVKELSADLIAEITEDGTITVWDWIKNLWADLKHKIETLFPNTRDKEVIITIPKISQVDEFVNELIYKFIRDIVPLITG